MNVEIILAYLKILPVPDQISDLLVVDLQHRHLQHEDLIAVALKIQFEWGIKTVFDSGRA